MTFVCSVPSWSSCERSLNPPIARDGATRRGKGASLDSTPRTGTLWQAILSLTSPFKHEHIQSKTSHPLLPSSARLFSPTFNPCTGGPLCVPLGLLLTNGQLQQSRQILFIKRIDSHFFPSSLLLVLEMEAATTAGMLPS